MSSKSPSIQSFFSREVPNAVAEMPSKAVGPGDGFTVEELEAAADPLKRSFNPEQEYELHDISTLTPGPRTVTFVGRIVNFNVHRGKSKSEVAAKGWHHLIVKDDWGAICVTLYFSQQPYQLSFGLLLTIWTPFISQTVVNDAFRVPNARISTSIFPGRDPAVHVIIHQKGDTGGICRSPLHYHKGQPLPGLITLKAFLEGGDEIPDCRILVYVKSIGIRRTITTKTGSSVEMQEVTMCDDTETTVLKLWSDTIPSTRDWKPSITILLISSPALKLDYGKGYIGLSHATMVDVDPEFPDAHWLRRHAAALMKRQNVSQVFPEDLWDVDIAVNAPVRILFTIADVDEWVRNNPNQVFTGFLNLIIMDLGLVLQHRRNMLMCNECCGVPVYANTPLAKCKNCLSDVQLSLNPRVMGTLIDETGSIGAGKLLWKESAWEQFFGRPIAELVGQTGLEMRLMEQRLLFMRFTLVFGWAEEVERLAVLAVME